MTDTPTPPPMTPAEAADAAVAFRAELGDAPRTRGETALFVLADDFHARAATPEAAPGDLAELRSKLDEWLAEEGISQYRRTALVQVREWSDARSAPRTQPQAPLPARVGVCQGRGRTTADCPGAFGYCPGCPVHPDRPAPATRDEGATASAEAGRFVVDVDASDPPLPRLAGPFATREAADAWITALVGGGQASWNVRPIAAPSDPVDGDASGDAQ